MYQPHNGVSATQLSEAKWQKSRCSGSRGNCVEMARLSTGQVAVRNSRHPDGPALIYTRAEIEALIRGAKEGDFDNLIQDPADTDTEHTAQGVGRNPENSR
jgi:hypothetical protein